MRIFTIALAFFLSACSATPSKSVDCSQRIIALSRAEVAAELKSDETLQASEKDPESSDLALAAANAASAWAAATAELYAAKASCAGSAM
jgi:hypothetical protein